MNASAGRSRTGSNHPQRVRARRARFSREEFRSRLTQLLAEQFPDETLESLTVSPDLEHSLSGNYARGLLRGGSTYAALLAVPDGESSETADNSLTFALLWLLRARQSNPSGVITTLRIILPKDTSPTVAHRLAALHSQCRVDLYERNPALETLEKIDPRRTANLDTWLVMHRESEALLDRALPALKEIIALAPLAITLHPVVQSREV